MRREIRTARQNRGTDPATELFGGKPDSPARVPGSPVCLPGCPRHSARGGAALPDCTRRLLDGPHDVRVDADRVSNRRPEQRGPLYLEARERNGKLGPSTHRVAIHADHHRRIDGVGLAVKREGARGPPSAGLPVVGAPPLPGPNFRRAKPDERVPVGFRHLAHLPVAPVVAAVEAGDGRLDDGTAAIGILGVEHEPPRHVATRSSPVVQRRGTGVVDFALGGVDRGDYSLRLYRSRSAE